MIRVVVVDDHEMVAESLVRLLSQQPDIEVAGVASTVEGGIATVATTHPDVAIVDYHLPDGDGTSAATRMKESDADVKVIILTGSGQPGAMFDAAMSGCDGYVEKTRALNELTGVVRSVRAGRSGFPPDVIGRLPRPDEVVAHYQPIVDLRSGAVAGFEALARWAHPERGLVGPGDFVPLAEKTGYIVQIGERMLQTSCEQVAAWARVSPADAAFVSVNLSGHELQREQTVSMIANVLEQTGLDPAHLVLEITETFLIGDVDHNIRRLHDLKALGVGIALDDFGTAYSSLGYLRRFPIDIIKMDKSFVDDVTTDPRVLPILENVVHLAESMELVTEAEGVESEEQARALRNIGFELAQGYHFSRPVSAADATALVMARSRPFAERVGQ